MIHDAAVWVIGSALFDGPSDMVIARIPLQCAQDLAMAPLLVTNFGGNGSILRIWIEQPLYAI